MSSDFFIGNASAMHGYQNLLVVYGEAGLVVVVDVEDKTCPQYLSSLIEDQTSDNPHITFVGNYMVGRSIVDISVPTSPRMVSGFQSHIKPVHSLSGEATGLYACGHPLVLKVIDLDEGGLLKVSNGLPCVDKAYRHPLDIYSCVSVFYDQQKLLVFTESEFVVLQQGVNQLLETKVLNIQKEVQLMVERCFNELAERHYGFKIGKVVLQCLPHYGIIYFAIHECSSMAIMPEVFSTHPLPVFSTYLQLYPYTKRVFDVDFDVDTVALDYDFDQIIDRLVSDPRFVARASRHVAVVADESTTYLHYPHNVWKPYRVAVRDQQAETVESMLLSGNENLLLRLSSMMVSQKAVFESLLDIVNTEIVEDCIASEEVFMTHKSTLVLDREVSYIEGPALNNLQRDQRRDIDLMRHEALKLLIKHPDRPLVKAIVLNAAMYNKALPVLENIPSQWILNDRFTHILTENMYGLLTEFLDDAAVKAFMLQYIDVNDLSHVNANIAFLYQMYGHSSIHKYLANVLESETYGGINYELYVGDARLPKIIEFPVDVLRPFEHQLLQIWERYNLEEEDHELAKQIVPVFDMLYKLGHENFSPKLLKKVEKLKKVIEQFASTHDGEDDFEESFLLRLYRKHVCKMVLKDFVDKPEGAIWPNAVPPEPYENSWSLIIDEILLQGEESLGTNFKYEFVKKLAANISKEIDFQQDRILAYNFVKHTYKHIVKHPQLASLAEIVFKAIDQNKGKFSKDINLSSIREQGKYALLQAAWNDLKNKEWDVAEQKGDAILAMDPNFGQVHFLKARLLWLKKGIAAYLDQKETFLKKAAHDSAALARLYNLTGCALDIEQRYQEALPYFKKAAHTVPDEAMYVGNIAEIYYKLHKPKEALNFAKKAIAAGSTNETLQEILSNRGLRPI